MDQGTKDIILAVVGACGGGLLIKVADKIWTDAAKREDSETAIRNELRLDAGALRAELKTARIEYDSLHAEYLKVSRELVTVQAKNASLEEQLMDLVADVQRLNASVQRLKKEVSVVGDLSLRGEPDIPTEEGGP